jgi:uncharacterized membrane protein
MTKMLDTGFATLVATFAATLAAIIVLDVIWLGLIARPLYRQGIGHLMADTPVWAAAVAFYLVYALGLLLFAVAPNAGAGWGRTALMAALFGFVAYATYDLSNLATLRGWPLGLSLLDIAWGSTLSAASALAGRAVLLRLAPV